MCKAIDINIAMSWRHGQKTVLALAKSTSCDATYTCLARVKSKL